MKNKIYQLLLIVLVLATSCKKESETFEPTTPTLNSKAITLACDTFSNAVTLIDYANKPVDYIINCMAEVTAELIIEPGVVIHFEQDAGLEIEETGSITAIAGELEGEEITFSSSTTVTGSWNNITIFSNSAKNKIQGCVIEYANGFEINGPDDLAAITLWGDAKASIDNNIIRNCKNYGFAAVYSGSTIESFGFNTFENCNTPIQIEAPYIGEIQNTNTFVFNTNNFILVQVEAVNKTTTWQKQTIPYRFIDNDFGNLRYASITNSTVVTIEPGTILDFSADVGLKILEGGALSAEGTELDPIIFTSHLQTLGAWRNIYFDFTQHPQNVIRHAVIEYAANNASQGAIYMWASPKLTVEGVHFNEIENCAFYHAPDVANPNNNLTQQSNTYTNVGTEVCGD